MVVKQKNLQQQRVMRLLAKTKTPAQMLNQSEFFDF